MELKMRANKFVILKSILYRRSLDGIPLWCIVGYEIHEAMSKVHTGVCGAHQLGPKIYIYLRRLGYY